MKHEKKTPFGVRVRIGWCEHGKEPNAHCAIPTAIGWCERILIHLGRIRPHMKHSL